MVAIYVAACILAIVLLMLPALSAPDEATQARMETVVKAALRAPESASFLEAIPRIAKSDNNRLVVCGKVTAQNGFGGMSKAVRFVFLTKAPQDKPWMVGAVFFADDASILLEPTDRSDVIYLSYCAPDVAK